MNINVGIGDRVHRKLQMKETIFLNISWDRELDKNFCRIRFFALKISKYEIQRANWRFKSYQIREIIITFTVKSITVKLIVKQGLDMFWSVCILEVLMKAIFVGHQKEISLACNTNYGWCESYRKVHIPTSKMVFKGIIDMIYIFFSSFRYTCNTSNTSTEVLSTHNKLSNLWKLLFGWQSINAKGPHE